MGFDQHRAVTSLLCHAAHLIEQHRFTNPTQAGQHQAFFWFTDQDSPEQDAYLFQNGRSPGQFWWRRTRTW